jgi:hypothetical protein
MPFPSKPLLALLAPLFLADFGPTRAQEVSLLIQRSTLAGYRYHQAPALAAAMKVGDTLDLVREPDNPYDANAVRVEWQGRKLGYVPRASNAALAWAMDGGETVTARVAREETPRRARGRVVFEILLQ